jgi:ABC-type uncharacterized transport system fused permease/ATPase subunit
VRTVSAADRPGDVACDDPPGIADGHSLRRFWREAQGFWRDRPVTAWGLIGALTACVVLQLLLQYKLNFWNRDFFNALEQRDSRAIWTQVYLLPVLVALFVALAIFAVWGRMTFQRSWRAWLTTTVTAAWFPSLRRSCVPQINGERQNAEYRIAEDARVATDAPIDLLVGLLSSLLGGATFIVVLWNIGGTLNVAVGTQSFSVEGYLVYTVLLYSTVTTVAMMWMGRHMIRVIERKNQAEADLRYELVHMREQPADIPMVEPALDGVVQQWRRLCDQHMRTTLVSQGNALLAPVIGLVLCVPKYVHGELQLGEVTQAAAAFFAVQSACNWLVDNYPRLAETLSSASRVGGLLQAIDAQAAGGPGAVLPVPTDPGQ